MKVDTSHVRGASSNRKLERAIRPMSDGDKPTTPHAAVGVDGATGTVATVAPELDSAADVVNVPKEIVGRSPGQLAWLRLKRDRVAVTSAILLAVIFLIAYAAPLIEQFYGHSPTAQNPDELDLDGRPLGLLNGVDSDHWLGIQPGTGRDVFMQIIYGMRTDLTIAIIGAVLTLAFGAVLGAVAGYFGGLVDNVINWITDVALCFPFLIFALATIPILGGAIAGEGNPIPAFLRATLLIGTFVFFGWMGTARLVRGQVLSLREREFVEAARASGAGAGHIIFKQVLPNVWAPILVTFSLLVPALVTTVAALSFLGVGMQEPVPDMGRIILDAVDNMKTEGMWFYFVCAGGSLFLLVLTFNLVGDSVRDALDPKSSR
jgi:peptide/nickel transport system permease protein